LGDGPELEDAYRACLEQWDTKLLSRTITVSYKLLLLLVV